MTCKNCGTNLPDNSKFCFGCGAKIAPKNIFCSQCGTSLPAGAKFCRNCGNSTQQSAAPAAAKAEPAKDLPTSLIGQDIPERTLPRPESVADEATAILSQNPQPALQPQPVRPVMQPQPRPVQPAPTAPKPVIQPPSPTIKHTKPKKKSGGVVAGIIIALLLIAAAGAAVYFMLFHDSIRQAELIEAAQAYAAADDWENAVEAYSECVLLGSKDAEVYLGLAEAYDECGELDKAVQALKDGYSVTGDERVWNALTEYEYMLVDE